GELEVLLPMGLEAEGTPHPLHRGFRHLRFGGERAARPVSPAFGRALEGAAEQRRDALVPNRARPAGAELIVEPLQALAQIALAPLPDRGLRQPQFLGDHRIAGPVGGAQDDPRAGHERLRERARAGVGDEGLPLGGRERERPQRATDGHGIPWWASVQVTACPQLIKLFMGHNTSGAPGPTYARLIEASRIGWPERGGCRRPAD